MGPAVMLSQSSVPHALGLPSDDTRGCHLRALNDGPAETSAMGPSCDPLLEPALLAARLLMSLQDALRLPRSLTRKFPYHQPNSSHDLFVCLFG